MFTYQADDGDQATVSSGVSNYTEVALRVNVMYKYHSC